MASRIGRHSLAVQRCPDATPIAWAVIMYIVQTIPMTSSSNSLAEVSCLCLSVAAMLAHDPRHLV